ncbi:hypothetical protein SLE2022_156550 [Rubroshorea leprosula]
MESLTSGVLSKLLKDMGVEEKAVDDVKNPVLLQIRSIIPVLAEGDLWPSQGFFLKVADSTQAMFVSLAPEEDEMVLCNKLQLGQFIYVDKLEAAYPVPVLKGVMPIPGRKPCIGDPRDLLGVDILEKSGGPSMLAMRERNDVKNKPRARYRSLSPHNVQPRERREGGASHSRPSTPEDWSSRGRKPSCGDKDSDSDSTASNPRRKSWSGIAKTRSGEFSDCTVVKHEIKPVHCNNHRVCNLQGSPVRSATASYENCEENSSTRTRIKDISLARKPVRSLNKSKNSLSERNSKELLTQAGVQASPSDRKWAETEILWDCLPLTLVKLGKEVLRQKEAALLAAVEALQEAAAAERLLKCLSSFSELRLAKEDDQQDSIDKFFKLQDYMVESRGIIQSLTNISPLRTPETDSHHSGSIGEALKLAVERKRNATTWIKAAVASDLTLVSTVKPQNASMEANNTTRRRNKQNVNKPKGTLIARKQRSIDEVYVGLAAEKENQPDWVKGSALNTAADLVQSLQDESRTWFLAYLEKHLDGFVEESGFKLSDSQFTETMCQMKRLNDWLDVMEKRERNGSGSVPGNSALEACGRIKKKIYGILLKHVERTAMVLENMNAMTEI